MFPLNFIMWREKLLTVFSNRKVAKSLWRLVGLMHSIVPRAVQTVLAFYGHIWTLKVKSIWFRRSIFFKSDNFHAKKCQKNGRNPNRKYLSFWFEYILCEKFLLTCFRETLFLFILSLEWYFFFKRSSKNTNEIE